MNLVGGGCVDGVFSWVCLVVGLRIVVVLLMMVCVFVGLLMLLIVAFMLF